MRATRRPRCGPTLLRAVGCAGTTALLAGSLACGDAPTGPREAVTPEGVLISASADRTAIVRGDTATVTYRLTNPRAEAVTIPISSGQGCRLWRVTYDARGAGVRDGADGCVAAGGDLTLAPNEAFTVRVAFTGRVTRADGTTFDYPAGDYALAVVVRRTSNDPYAPLPESPRVSIRVRDR